MTPDAQALAPVLVKLNGDELTYAWIPDADAALDWVADMLHAEGDAGDALRERLGLVFSVQFGSRRLVGLWEPKP